MNWNKYREIIKNTPFTEGLNYAPVAVWLHPENIPVGIIPSGDIKEKIIRIPETAVNKYGKTVQVAAVGKDAFCGCAAVTDIIIPPCVSAIYQGAFAGCLSLERITVPKAVKKIGQCTFESCTALTDIYYEGSPDEWKEIEIVHYKHEVELGELTPGSPVQEKVAERYIHIPGNEPLYSANIHFFCVI